MCGFTAQRLRSQVVDIPKIQIVSTSQTNQPIQEAATFEALRDKDCHGEGQVSGHISRRCFLRLSVLTAAGFAILGPQPASGGPSLVIIDNARAVILADPSRCVGCGRCELACTEFNDGAAQPAMARIKVSRNLAFGPMPSGSHVAAGLWGNGLAVPDICRQCHHPVPCAEACPSEAIIADQDTGARIVDPARCAGCRLCLTACPWAMISFNGETGKATKCFLCQGKPKCVDACPAEALRLIPWRDLSRDAPPRVAALSGLSPEKAASCRDCHK